MKKRMIFVVLVVLALFTMACSCSLAGFPNLTRGSVAPSGETVSEEREVPSSIKEVEISGSGSLFFTQGETAELILQGDSNYVNNIETRINGDTLVIRPKQNFFFSWFHEPDEVIYYLTLPKLERMQVSGAVDVELSDLKVQDLELSLSGSPDLIGGMITGEEVNISGSGSTNVVLSEVECVDFSGDFSGSSDFQADRIAADTIKFESSASYDMDIEYMKADEIKISASGSADMSIDSLYAATLIVDTTGSAHLQIEQGSVDTQSIEMSGSGTYVAEDLVSGITKINAVGATEFYLNVTETLDIVASGSSQINYLGNPEITQETSGSVSVDSMDD